MAKLVDALHSKCSDFGHESSSLSPPIHSALSPEHWPFELADLPDTLFLVGGCVRDALLGHASPYLDLDFVVPSDPVGLAQAIARHYQAGFVQLDSDRQIARVVFAHTTADFALQMGNSVEEDLQRRDFTVNAIAYHPHSQTLIDPLKGAEDIQRRLIRMVHPQNLADDPLRLLRAYRQAAQLGFQIDPDTRTVLQNYGLRLARVAAERIRVEIGYLLSDANGTHWLAQLFQDGLLSICFPQATLAGIEWLAGIDQAYPELQARYPALAQALNTRLSQRAQGAEALRRTLLSTVKLVSLVDPSVVIAEQTLCQLKYSRSEIRLVTTILQALGAITTPVDLDTLAQSPILQYHFFRQLGDCFPAFIVVAMGRGFRLGHLQPFIDLYQDPTSPIAHPQPLLTGTELMNAIALAPGPQVGELLHKIALAQAEGLIHTPEEAIEFARQCGLKSAQ